MVRVTPCIVTLPVMISPYPPWLQVRYEDVVNDLEGEARRCLQSLGLAWDPAVMKYRERLGSKAVRSPSYEAVTRPVFKTAIGRWRNYARYLEPVLPVLEPFVREFGYSDAGVA